jgi:outer membrane protein
MRILICLSLLLISLSFLNAQTEKGRIITGTILDAGNGLNDVLLAPANTLGLSFTDSKIDFGGNTSTESRITTLTFRPHIGYFLADGFALGINTIYLYQSVRPKDNNAEIHIHLYSVGPFVKYYFQVPNFKPFIEASLNIGQRKQETELVFGGPGEGTSNFSDTFLGVGGAYFIKNTLALELSLGFRQLSVEADPDISEQKLTSNTLGMRLGFQLLLN